MLDLCPKLCRGRPRTKSVAIHSDLSRRVRRVADHAIAHATNHATAAPATRLSNESTVQCCARPRVTSVCVVNVHDSEGSTMDPNGTTALIAEQDLGVVTTTAKVDDKAETVSSSAGTLTPLLMTIREVAVGLRIGRSTVYELIASGGLEVVHIGRAARIPVQAVYALVQRLRVEEASSADVSASVS